MYECSLRNASLHVFNDEKKKTKLIRCHYQVSQRPKDQSETVFLRSSLRSRTTRGFLFLRALYMRKTAKTQGRWRCMHGSLHCITCTNICPSIASHDLGGKKSLILRNGMKYKGTRAASSTHTQLFIGDFRRRLHGIHRHSASHSGNDWVR